MLTILLAVLAAATNAIASVLQRKANLREVEADRSGLAGLADLVRQPLWLAGIGAVIASFLLQAGALGTGELAEVQPLLSLELPLTLMIASFVFHQRLDGPTWGDIAVMTGGIALFLFAVHPTPGAPGRAGGLTWVLGVGATTGLVVLLAVLSYLSSGQRRAALLGVAAGIAFALTAVFMSVALANGLSWALFTHWEVYLVAVAGLTAMVLLQEGLQAGSLVAVQPGVTLSDPVIAVTLAVLLFHEGVRTGLWLVPELLGAAAVAWGAVRLSRSPVARTEQDGPQQSAGPPASSERTGPDPQLDTGDRG